MIRAEQAREEWPLAARLILLFGVTALILSSLGNLSMLRHLGRETVGVFTYWSEVEGCHVVSQLTPNTWPGMDGSGLRPLDCIESVDGIPMTDDARVAEYLAGKVQQRGSGRYVSLSVRRGDETFSVETPATEISLLMLLQMQFVMIFAGLALWLLGLLVLFADPTAEANWVLASFLFIGNMVLMGANHAIPPPWGTWYSYVVIIGGRPFLGALLFHLTFLFPQPIFRGHWQRLRFALYPLAAIATLLTMFEVFLVGSSQPWFADAVLSARVLIFGIFAGGEIFFVARGVAVALRPSSYRAGRQARWLLAGWMLAVPMSFFEIMLGVLRLPWLLPGTSNLTFMVWVVAGAALIAYAMLRYQAFAYRGRALTAVVILIVTATLTQLIGLVIAPRGLDGVQFATLWSAVLLATLFWFADTPLRSLFRRLFLRHEYDYEIANRFSHHLAEVRGVDDTLPIAVAFICRELDVAWALITTPLRPGMRWLKRWDAEKERVEPMPAGQELSALAEAPEYDRSIRTATGVWGHLWLGPRITAEPFDQQDAQLVTLLVQELARTLAVHAQIEDLEQVPGRILAAVEADRQRIGQDLHDGVLQYLGTIPLELERAGALATTRPAAAQAILEKHVEQASAITAETRAIVYDLSPPALARTGLLAHTRSYVEQMCNAHGMELDWRSEGQAWQSLDEARALQVYRIVQQAVSNAVQHGAPAHIAVQFSQRDASLRVSVSDDGRGFDPTLAGDGDGEGGLGLFSMQERAKALGGRLWVESSPGKGTTVNTVFPLALPAPPGR